MVFPSSLSTNIKPDPLFAGGAFEAGSIEDADLFSFYGNDAGAPKFTQRHGGGFAVNAEMLGNFFLCPATQGAVLLFLQQQGGQAWDQLPERSVLQVLKHMEESLTDEFEKAIRDNRVLLEESLQIAARNRANARRLDGFRGAVIHALPDAAHLSKNGGRDERGNDQLFRAQFAEGLHAPFFQKEQNLAAFAGLKEDVSGGEFTEAAFALDRAQNFCGKAGKQIDSRKR